MDFSTNTTTSSGYHSLMADQTLAWSDKFQVVLQFIFHPVVWLLYVSLTHANVQESTGKPCTVYEKSYFFLLHVTQEYISVLCTSHARTQVLWVVHGMPGCVTKSKVGTYQGNISLLALLLVLCTPNSTDSNKVEVTWQSPMSRHLLFALVLLCGLTFAQLQ